MINLARERACGVSVFLQSSHIHHYLPFGARLWSGTRSQPRNYPRSIWLIRDAPVYGGLALGLEVVVGFCEMAAAEEAGTG